MKMFLVGFSVLFLGMTTVQTSVAQNKVQLKMMRDYDFEEAILDLSDVYIPNGFDQDSDAFVVVSGVYPNGCYRWKDAEIEHKGEFVHNVTSRAQVSQGMCIMVLVPFTKEIRIGKLSSGKHTLRFLSGDGTYFEKTLKVE
ncbi:MAG: hypothetical protein ACK5P5_11935 [Pseudobdellovibrionaceae bacterium]|jgi:hypothetical protein